MQHNWVDETLSALDPISRLLQCVEVAGYQRELGNQMICKACVLYAAGSIYFAAFAHASVCHIIFVTRLLSKWSWYWQLLAKLVLALRSWNR